MKVKQKFYDSTLINNFYSIFYQDKIVKEIFHLWDETVYSSLEEALEAIKNITEKSPFWTNKLSVFKNTIEKI